MVPAASYLRNSKHIRGGGGGGGGGTGTSSRKSNKFSSLSLKQRFKQHYSKAGN